MPHHASVLAFPRAFSNAHKYPTAVSPQRDATRAERSEIVELHAAARHVKAIFTAGRRELM